MPREMTCPRGHRLQVADADLGHEVRCPTCGVSFFAGEAPAGQDVRQPPILPQAGAALSAIRDRLGAAGAWPLASLKVGRPMVMVGLVLVLLARGCDSLAQRSVQRAAAQLALAQSAFDDEFQTRRTALQQDSEVLDQQIRALMEKTDRTEGDNAQMEELRKKRAEVDKKLSDLTEEQRKNREALQRTTWRTLESASRDAPAENQLNAYWRELLFLFGTLVLMFGLLIVSWTAEGAERWVCLMMLAVITFSLYVGGTAWSGAIGGH